MKYDFDTVINRRGTDSTKWATRKLYGDEDVLPLWVADMDFPVPPAVVEAIQQRAQHPIFGYASYSPAYYKAITGWMQKRHGWDVQPGWITHTPGVVPGLNIAIQAFTHPGDKIVIQPPVYYPFANAIRNNGRQLAFNPLVLKDGTYRMDLHNLEQQMDARTKLLIFCSPHNPVGRVWDKDELLALGELCLRKNVCIVSDEIHSDLIMRGYKHTPLATLSDDLAQNTMTFIAPSKTFNLAGLYTSIAIIPNPRLLAQFNIALENVGLGAGNTFGIVALEAVYRAGEEWLEQLLEYIRGNMEFLTEFLAQHVPQIKPTRLEGTYLVWLDCRALGLDDVALKNLFLKRAKVALNAGVMFGIGGEGFMRMNLACPRSTLAEALQRIECAAKEITVKS